MRLLLISLMLSFIQFYAFSQERFDEVRIYIYPHTPTLGTAMDECDWNENSIRVNSHVKITITEINEINEIQTLLLNKSLSVDTESHFFQCQMIVDFIRSNKIRETIAISNFEQVRINEDKSSIFKLDRAIKDFFVRHIEFFREIHAK